MNAARHWIPNPKGGFDKHRRCEQLFPALEATPDLSRAEVRFAAEALVEMIHGRAVPREVMDRVLIIADVMAAG